MKKVGRPKGSYKKTDPNKIKCYGGVYRDRKRVALELAGKAGGTR